jgi:putative peptidoglycan lipid II flippase
MVARFFSVLYREVKGLHQAAYVLALFTLASQLLAIVRDRALAHQFGAGSELDIYYAAFRIPDVLFVLFASVLSVYVLLPFIRTRTDREGRGLLSQMFSLFLMSYSVLALCIFIAAPFIVEILFPGFAVETSTETVALMRILLLQPIFLGISSLCGVVTQLQHRFIIFALSPLLYNVGILVGVLFLYDWWGLAGLAVGVVMGAFAHMLIQIPLVYKSQYHFSFTMQYDWLTLWSVARVAIPRAFTLSVHQIQFLFFATLASTMAVGSVSVFQFAFNLQSVPLAIIGASYSVAAFPTLTRLFSEQKQQDFNHYIITVLRHILFWSLPIIALVIVLRAQIVRVLLGSGSFDWDDTRLTAAVLAIFIITLTLQSGLLLLTRALYAGGRTLIPLIVAVVGVCTGAVLALLSYRWIVMSPAAQEWFVSILRLQDVTGIEVIAIPIGFSIGVLVELVVLGVVMSSLYAISFRPLIMPFLTALTAATVGGFMTYMTLYFVVEGVNQNTFIGIAVQGLLGCVVGIVAIVTLYYGLGSRELTETYKSFRTKIFKTDVVAPQPDIL